MAPSTPSIGRMISHGLDAVPKVVRKSAGRTRHEAMARGMLDHLLRNKKARRNFTRRLLDVDSEVLAFRTTTRRTGDTFDLVAQATKDAAVTGTLAMKLVIDGSLDGERISTLLRDLGEDPSSRLVLVLPRTRRAELDVVDARLKVVTWHRIASRLADKDADRGPLWVALSEFGEREAALDVQEPVAPKILLDEDVADEFHTHLKTLLLVANTLIRRPPRFSSSRSHPRAWLHAGGSRNDLGVEFGAVEDGSAIWLVGSAPRRSVGLRLGALGEADADEATARLEQITEREDWRTDPEADIEIDSFIGERATRKLEDARSLLWDVFDPGRLERAGFPLLPRQQPDMEADRLSVRVHAPEIPRSGTFLVSVGGSKTWRTLLPKVTREFDGRTYVVQAKKSDTAQDLVTAVHDALHSLATKP